MKTSSRFHRIIPILTALAITAPFVALAAVGDAQDLVTPIANNILKTVNVFVTIVFVLAVVAFGWGIVQFIFAAGDPTTLAKAKQFLLWGVIGIAVMASIFGVVTFLQNYLGVKSGVLPITPPTVGGGAGGTAAF